MHLKKVISISNTITTILPGFRVHENQQLTPTDNRQQEIGFTFIYLAPKGVLIKSISFLNNEGRLLLILTPDLYDQCSEDIQKNFTKEYDPTTSRVIYCYSTSNYALKHQKIETLCKRLFIAHQPKERATKEVCNPPIKLTKDEWISHYHSKKNTTIFYIGAGLSVPAGLPTLHQVEASTFLNIPKQINSKNTLHIYNTALQELFCHRDEDIKKRITETLSSFNAPPTDEHILLAKLSQKTHRFILTENLDFLLENAGCESLRVRPNQIEVKSTKNLYYSSFDAIDWGDITDIVCLGLSGDQSGLLHHMKDKKPDCTISVINLEGNFNGPCDYIVSEKLENILLEI